GPGARAASAQREAVRRRPPAAVSAPGLAAMKESPPPGLVDSHCHLDFPEFQGRMAEVREAMRASGVTHALCISVNLSGFPNVLALAETYDNFFASVGVHPDHEERTPVDPGRLVELARHPR